MYAAASAAFSDVGGALKKKAPVVNHRGQTNPAQVS
jgi:hypothetical protein